MLIKGNNNKTKPSENPSSALAAPGIPWFIVLIVKPATARLTVNIFGILACRVSTMQAKIKKIEATTIARSAR